MSIQAMDSLKRTEQVEHQLLLTVIIGGFDAFFSQREQKRPNNEVKQAAVSFMCI